MINNLFVSKAIRLGIVVSSHNYNIWVLLKSGHPVEHIFNLVLSNNVIVHGMMQVHIYYV
jgi:hypothetical protein